MGNATTASVTGVQVAPAKSAIRDLPIAKVWAFAVGQFGWALLSGIISNWLVYFYQPDQETISQGQTVFVPQGLVVLGIVTVVGGYYIALTFYCTPYNALIAELGHDSKQQLTISTAISFTWVAGTAIAYVAPVIWGAFVPMMGRITAIRVTFTIMAAVAFVCMLVPPLAIREKDYVNSHPTSESTIESLKQTFGDGEFRKFVCSDVVYWVAITTFQTGLPFFVTSLLKLPETTTTIYFVLMTGVSVLFYLPVNILANKVGKKRLLLVAFVIFTCAFAFAGALGSAVLGFIPAMAQGLVLSVVGAIPMAAFGILPQAIVANIADASSKTTGQDRQGMFYAARTFAMKMGQSVAMLLFTGVSTIGMASGAGYRIAAVCAAVLCGLGGIVSAFYNEKKVLGVLET